MLMVTSLAFSEVSSLICFYLVNERLLRNIYVGYNHYPSFLLVYFSYESNYKCYVSDGISDKGIAKKKKKIGMKRVSWLELIKCMHTYVSDLYKSLSFEMIVTDADSKKKKKKDEHIINMQKYSCRLSIYNNEPTETRNDAKM